MKLNIVIDTAVVEEGSVRPPLRRESHPSNMLQDHGVVVGEGDGTVPLLSSGYMCSKGWKMKRYNPAGVQVKTYEMLHEPDTFDIRYVSGELPQIERR